MHEKLHGARDDNVSITTWYSRLRTVNTPVRDLLIRATAGEGASRKTLFHMCTRENITSPNKLPAMVMLVLHTPWGTILSHVRHAL